MPFLRFSRDKRGYENTYLMHTYRRQGSRPAILYWFRTPPNVKVGRAALDEEAIRAIEETHPDLTFDWTKILESPAPGGPPSEPMARSRRDAGRARSGSRRGAARASAGFPEVPVSAEVHAEAENAGKPEGPPVEPMVQASPDEIQDVGEEDVGEDFGSHSVPDDEGASLGSDLVEDSNVDSQVAGPAILRVLSSDQVATLRARYAAILARISERMIDPVKLESLREQAARLDPDTWVTDEDVRRGLEEYETVYQELRSVVGSGRGRRSRRRGARRREEQGSPPGSGATGNEREE